jgi:hypothetical protein
MTNQNAKRFVELINDNYDKLIKEGMECYADSYTIQDDRWHMVLVLFKDGEIRKLFRDKAVVSEDEYNSQAIEILNFSKHEYPDIQFKEYLVGMSDQEIVDFKKYLIQRYDFDANYDFNEDEEEIFNFDNLVDYNYDIIKRIDETWVKMAIEQEGRQLTIEAIENTLHYLEDCIPA